MSLEKKLQKGTLVIQRITISDPKVIITYKEGGESKHISFDFRSINPISIQIEATGDPDPEKMLSVDVWRVGHKKDVNVRLWKGLNVGPIISFDDEWLKQIITEYTLKRLGGNDEQEK